MAMPMTRWRWPYWHVCVSCMRAPVINVYKLHQHQQSSTRAMKMKYNRKLDSRLPPLYLTNGFSSIESRNCVQYDSHALRFSSAITYLHHSPVLYIQYIIWHRKRLLSFNKAPFIACHSRMKNERIFMKASPSVANVPARESLYIYSLQSNNTRLHTYMKSSGGDVDGRHSFFLVDGLSVSSPFRTIFTVDLTSLLEENE